MPVPAVLSGPKTIVAGFPNHSRGSIAEIIGRRRRD
jgi:hypothetical protein